MELFLHLVFPLLSRHVSNDKSLYWGKAQELGMIKGIICQQACVKVALGSMRIVPKTLKLNKRHSEFRRWRTLGKSDPNCTPH